MSRPGEAVQKRVRFDFEIEFSNGGGLQGQDFRLDVEGHDISDAWLAAYIVRDLRLLMVGNVRIIRKQIIVENHKRAGFAAASGAAVLVDLSHTVETYLDTPFHRFDGAGDLADLPLARIANLEGVVVRAASTRAVTSQQFADIDVRGKAVLVQTGWDRHWRTDAYSVDSPFLTAEAARYLVEHGAVTVGIDSLNIDDTRDLARPVHSVLLKADIPIIEHLCNLGALPDEGFRFFAVPVKVRNMGTFPVRAFAILDH